MVANQLGGKPKVVKVNDVNVCRSVVQCCGEGIDAVTAQAFYRPVELGDVAPDVGGVVRS
jgi:hypothetical protein